MRRLLCSAVFFGCAGVTVAAGVLDGGQDAGLPDGDDECVGGDEQCALSAMQLRGRRVGHVAAGAGEDATGGVCDSDPIARSLLAAAPKCVEACPQLCSVAVPAMAAMSSDGGGPALCASAAIFACALDEANQEHCRPAIEEARQSMGGTLPVPETRAEFEAMCAGFGANAASDDDVAAALLQRAVGAGAASEAEARSLALDKALSGKEADSRCKHASEGQTCISKNSWIYCSAHKRLSGPVMCEQRVGRMSLCRTDGVGLSKDYCDDPFCRNGGAYAGSGKYCHKDEVVYCRGSDPPRTVDSCPDRTWTDSSNQQHTEYNYCVGSYPNPRCSLIVYGYNR